MEDAKFQAEHDRILEEWSARRGGVQGAFYLLSATAPEMAQATKVVNEGEYEKEFRTRMDGDQNPSAVLVILPV